MGDSTRSQRDAGSGQAGQENPRLFSTENAARFGRFTIPFPFSVMIGIVAFPLFVVAAVLSVPYSAMRGIVVARQEDAFRQRMSLAGRTVSWANALLEVGDTHGTFIEEYISIKDRSRLWVTAETIADVSPFPCNFEELPWFAEGHQDFYHWCGSRYTAPDTGIAKLVEIQGIPHETLRASFEVARSNLRYVITAHLPEKG